MNALALIATLGIDTSQYERGLKDATGSAQDFASKLGNILKTAAKFKLAFDFGKSAVDAYKEYEQLVGGVDTLFKKSSKQIQGYAEQAYKTAGMSANQYMSTAIGFSASLLNSLGGDTRKAAKQTDRAITDMADNANKMGTSLEMVQNAYRGFARGNFTMLDNLSLGFSGTKEGMQELLDKAEQLSGVKYDISSMSDIIDAIHEVQVAMDITGTTAKEAMETIEGSAKAVQSSWQNVLTAIAGGGDFDQAINGLINSLFGNGSGGFVNNLMTRVTKVVKGVATFVGKAAPLFVREIPKLLFGIAKSIITSIPSMITDIVQGIPNAIAGIFEGIDDVILPIFSKTVDRASDSFKNVKRLIESGIKGTITLGADDGTEVLKKASDIVEELKSDTYKGKIVIDGDPEKAESAIAALDKAIADLTSGEGSVTELQKAIEDCEQLTINPDLPPEEVAAVEERLNELKEKLDELKNKTISVSFGYYKTDDSNDTAWNSFKSFVDARGWESKDFTYSATGKFAIEESTAEQIEAYARAITHAATAISDYDEAVSGITTVAEQKLKTDIANVEMQANEELKELAILYNKGTLTEEQYKEYGENILKKVEEQVRELTDSYNETVEKAQRFADSRKDNDYDTALEMNAELYAGEELSADTYGSAVANLKEMREEGRAATENDQISAKIARDFLTERAGETKAMIDQAVEDYKTAIAKADEKQAEVDQTLAAINDYAAPFAQLVSDMASQTDIEKFNPFENDRTEVEDAIKALIDFDKNIDNTISEDVDTQGLIDLVTSILYDEEGNAREIDFEEFETAAADVLSEMKASIQETADDARQEAETALQEALKAAGENNEMSAESITELIELIREAGVDVADETAALITNVENAAETAANQSVEESENAIQNSLDTIASLNDAVVSLEQNEESAITSGGQSGAASMGQSIITEGVAAAESVGAALDDAIGKPRHVGVPVGPLNYTGHATAMSNGEILNGLTPFGIDSNGTIHYGGEVGPEAVVGVGSLDSMIQSSVNRAVQGVLGRLDTIISGQGSGLKVVLDSGVLVGEIAGQMDSELNEIASWKGGGHAL